MSNLFESVDERVVDDVVVDLVGLSPLEEGASRCLYSAPFDSASWQGGEDDEGGE